MPISIERREAAGRPTRSILDHFVLEDDECVSIVIGISGWMGNVELGERPSIIQLLPVRRTDGHILAGEMPMEGT